MVAPLKQSTSFSKLWNIFDSLCKISKLIVGFCLNSMPLVRDWSSRANATWQLWHGQTLTEVWPYEVCVCAGDVCGGVRAKWWRSDTDWRGAWPWGCVAWPLDILCSLILRVWFCNCEIHSRSDCLPDVGWKFFKSWSTICQNGAHMEKSFYNIVSSLFLFRHGNSGVILKHQRPSVM